MSREHRDELYAKYAGLIKVDPTLSRAQVSFQASKKLPFSWMKFKEAYSPALVKRFLGDDPGELFDPFSGSGTSLFTAVDNGWGATGFELLPVGIEVIGARMASSEVPLPVLDKAINNLKVLGLDTFYPEFEFQHVGITKGAFPPETEIALSSYRSYVSTIQDDNARLLLRLAGMTVLEEVSYTSKDGQCLRWDRRSGRSKSQFEKAVIKPFKQAVVDKLTVMRRDIAAARAEKILKPYESPMPLRQKMKIYEESTLFAMPYLPSSTFNLIMTSPPYANRYDYTRTYALELAYLGWGEDQIKKLRQMLLSATVENRCKGSVLEDHYKRMSRHEFYCKASMEFFMHKPSWELHTALMKASCDGKINNENVVPMVRRYLSEMNLVIWEMARITAVGGRVVMVNDNVQYGGEEVPMDLLLCDYAEMAGLKVDEILVLPRGKGNSSQQMGQFGRRELRKCIYVWKKETECATIPTWSSDCLTNQRTGFGVGM